MRTNATSNFTIAGDISVQQVTTYTQITKVDHKLKEQSQQLKGTTKMVCAHLIDRLRPALSSFLCVECGIPADACAQYPPDLAARADSLVTAERALRESVTDE